MCVRAERSMRSSLWRLCRSIDLFSGFAALDSVCGQDTPKDGQAGLLEQIVMLCGILQLNWVRMVCPSLAIDNQARFNKLTCWIEPCRLIF